MREVLPELLRWWRAGETVGVGTVVATLQSAPRPPGASMLVGPDGEAVGSVSGGCVEGAVYELAQEVVESGDAGAPALRRQRRRRLRRRADLRRHPRRLRRDGLARDLPRARRRRRRHRGRPAGRGGHGGRAPGPGPGRPAPRRPRRRTDLSGAAAARSGSRAARRRRHRRRPRPAGRRAQRDPHLRAGRRASRRGDAGLRRRLRAARRGCWSSAPSTSPRPCARVGTFLGYHGDGVRRAAGVRDGHPLPRRRRGGRRLAAPLPARPRSRPVGSTRARCSACSPTTRSSTCPLLEVALRLPEVAYIGAMGSRRTHEDRLDRLREAGMTDDGARPGCPARSGSTSARGPRRRPRCPSPPRSSPSGGAARGPGSPTSTARSTTRPADVPDLSDLPGTRQVRASGSAETCCTKSHPAQHDLTQPPHRKESRMTRINVDRRRSRVPGRGGAADAPGPLPAGTPRARSGTVVGCDTSNCGACTVHLDGRSVKSLQRAGRPGRRRRGRRRSRASAQNGELHPMQKAFHECHALQCGYCTPGMIMAGDRPAQRQPRPDRAGDPRRARGQPLPLHRLPQHRQGRAAGRGGERRRARRR